MYRLSKFQSAEKMQRPGPMVGRRSKKSNVPNRPEVIQPSAASVAPYVGCAPVCASSITLCRRLGQASESVGHESLVEFVPDGYDAVWLDSCPTATAAGLFSSARGRLPHG